MDDSIQSETARDSEENVIHASKGIRLNLRKTIEESEDIVRERGWEKELNRKRKNLSNEEDNAPPEKRQTRSGRTYAVVESDENDSLIIDEEGDTENKETSSQRSPKKPPEEPTQMETASLKSYAVMSDDSQGIDVESRNSNNEVLSQTTRQVQNRAVHFDVDLGPSQFIDCETLESFESDHNDAKKTSSDDEETIVSENSSLGESDLCTSLVSVALTPSPSSIMANFGECRENVTVTITSQNYRNNDQEVLTQQEVDEIAREVDSNLELLESYRTVQAQVSQRVRSGLRLNLADFAILESGHFEPVSGTNHKGRKTLGADFVQLIKNDPAFKRKTLPKSPSETNSNLRPNPDPISSTVRNISPPRPQPPPDRHLSDLESNGNISLKTKFLKLIFSLISIRYFLAWTKRKPI